MFIDPWRPRNSPGDFWCLLEPPGVSWSRLERPGAYTYSTLLTFFGLSLVWSGLCVLELVGWFGAVGYFLSAVGQFCICLVGCWPILYLFRWVVGQMVNSKSGLYFQKYWPADLLGRPTNFYGGPTTFPGGPPVTFFLEVVARFLEVTPGSGVKI